MKVLILAGGHQSTINDGGESMPKPMVDVGGKPMLWHIMKYFSTFGLNDFIICGGYKVDMIKEYFKDYYIYQSDICVNLRDNKVDVLKNRTEDWNVYVVDTGLETSTARRIAMVQDYIGEDDFIVSYGDVLSDIDVAKLIDTHKSSGKVATMAVARPTGRNELMSINEKGELVGYGIDPSTSNVWTNASVFVFKKAICDYFVNGFELDRQIRDYLIPAGEVDTYKHAGFWIPVETRRDYVHIQELWDSLHAPWLRWED